MKSIVLLYLFLVVAVPFSSAGTTSLNLENTFPSKKILLTAGTLVSLETAEKLNSGQATIGLSLKFKVVTNVVVDGVIVIKTGAKAIGRVKTITKSTYNAPEALTIELTSVQVVDGQMIALNGNEQTIKGIFPNEGTLLNPGRSIEANVMNDVEILID